MKGQLERLFPSLTTFSDLNWDEVSREYEATSIHISFPEYLQIKAEQGDCPPYLYELAFYEMATDCTRNSEGPFPHQQGVYLNPTALFLALHFDVPKMLEEAERGSVQVIERDHVLCLYRGTDDSINSIELDESDLKLLQNLEEGPRKDASFAEGHWDQYRHLVDKGIILDLAGT